MLLLSWRKWRCWCEGGRASGRLPLSPGLPASAQPAAARPTLAGQPAGSAPLLPAKRKFSWAATPPARYPSLLSLPPLLLPPSPAAAPRTRVSQCPTFFHTQHPPVLTVSVHLCLFLPAPVNSEQHKTLPSISPSAMSISRPSLQHCLALTVSHPVPTPPSHPSQPHSPPHHHPPPPATGLHAYTRA